MRQGADNVTKGYPNFDYMLRHVYDSNIDEIIQHTISSIGNNYSAFQEAKDVCQNKKSKLVEIDSREENTAIVNEVIKQRFRAQKQNFWLGLTDQEVEGDWRWTNGGERPSFTDWYPGEPNNAGSEGQNCAILNTKDGKNKWYDIPCHREKIAWETFHALCEKLPSTSGPPPPGCDCRPGGITKDSR